MSKSKAGNIDDLMKVRSLLAKLDIEVVEHMSGEYDSKLMTSCDEVLFLPPSLPEPYTFEFTMGKGQSSERDRCEATCMKYSAIVIVSDEVYIAPFTFERLLGRDWKTNFEEFSYDSADVHQLRAPLKKMLTGNKVLDRALEQGVPVSEITKIKPMLACATLYNIKL